MSHLTLENFSQELLIRILEQVGGSIVQDLVKLDIMNYHDGYGRLLNRFLQLNLVSKLFNVLLTHYVHVDGTPLRSRLLDLQMQKLTNYLESAFTFGRYLMHNPSSESLCTWRSDRGIHITGADILRNCGFVWKNPTFRSVCYPNLWLNPCWCVFLRETKIWLIFLLRDLFKDQLQVENMGSGDDFIYNQGYKTTVRGWGYMSTPTIEFIVGQDKFLNRRQAPVGWVGLSILSYKVQFRETITQGEGEEGRYWLWFVPYVCDGIVYCLFEYLVIDYKAMTAMDADLKMYDLKKYGEKI
jgi:hypothetical protein